MKNKPPKSIFYDYNKLWSYNAMINFIIGERGGGKTYGALKASIQDFLKNHRQFLYIRRTQVELDESLPKIFDAIKINEEFPDYEFHVKGNTLFINDEIIGFGVALSTAKNLKSNTFTSVYTAIYDEFIIEGHNGKYLKNEVNAFFNVLETVMRLRDFRCVLLGNAVSISNPYFDEFGIDKPYNSEFKLYKDGLILVHYTKNQAYRDYKAQTKFGRLISGTEYGNYAIKNEMLCDNNSFIEKKTGKCRHWSVIIIDNIRIGVWINYQTGLVYLSKDYDPKHPCIVVFDLNQHNNSTILAISKTNQWVRPIADALRDGRLRFESQKIKNAAMRVLAKML